MKNLLLICVAGLSLTASAQVQVNRYGQIVVGSDIQTIVSKGSESRLNSFDPITPVNPGLIFTTDSLAKICIIGEKFNHSGGYITFGNNKNVSIGEAASTSRDTDCLQLIGTGGLTYDNKAGNVFSYAGSTFNFNCNVKVDGVSVTSDSRLKSDVQEISGSAASLDAINPVSYTLVPSAQQRALVSDGDNSAQSARRVAPDPQERFGFIAQEVREIFPQLVSEDEEGYLSVDYIGFIPLLVDAVKELSAKVDQQQQIIAALSQQQPSRKRASSPDGPAAEVASMAQNSPNPFSQSTVIAISLPENVAEASVFIYDMQGRQLMSIPVADRGNTSVTVNAKTLTPGMFIYTLIADGQEVATKRMILTD